MNNVLHLAISVLCAQEVTPYSRSSVVGNATEILCIKFMCISVKLFPPPPQTEFDNRWLVTEVINQLLRIAHSKNVTKYALRIRSCAQLSVFMHIKSYHIKRAVFVHLSR